MHWTLVALHWWAAVAVAAASPAIRVLAFPRSPSDATAAVAEDRPPPPDVVPCLRAMSYTCLQRKTVVYLDRLNRLDSVPLLGGFVTAVRTRPVDRLAPRIDERLLDSRGFRDVLSLSFLVDAVVRSMVRDHALRVRFPGLSVTPDSPEPPTAR